jgi:predicted lipoprotein with Yx(FWY)xxD motif
MRSVVAAMAVSAVSALLLGGCGSDGAPAETVGQPTPTETATPSSSAAPPESPSVPPKAAGTAVKTASSQFGQILFDDTGQAIYLFDKETTAKPDCYGACAKAWPPVLTDGPPVANGGTRADRLGTTKRTNGSLQVTYAGHPLYYYAHEGKNEVLCHNVREFGGLWLAVTPAGEPAPH